MNLSRMSNDELRLNAEACKRLMAKRPPTAASHKLASRQFHQYAAELHARAQRSMAQCAAR